tara:strand:+ start:1283 stop:1549 length:267 start_codon:yes stop_codon:yes gene_type:complete
MSRLKRVYAGEEIISETYSDITWKQLRRMRNSDLKRTDILLVVDRPLSDETREALISYRQSLRDLPTEYPGDNANDAYDNYPSQPEVE